MENSPDHYSNSTKLYSWHYALEQVTFSWHLPNLDSSVRLSDGGAWFTTLENVFPLLQWWRASHPSSRSLVLCMLILDLCAAARPWKPISWSSRGSVVSVATEDRRWTNLLERWHPMSVPRWKSLSSSVRPFYCQCLSMEIAWRCARLYTFVIHGCGWNSRIH